MGVRQKMKWIFLTDSLLSVPESVWMMAADISALVGREVPATVGVSGQHTVLTGAVVATETQRHLGQRHL